MITTVPFHVYRRSVERAAEMLGGEARLARYLDVPLDKLRAWRTGGELTPLVVFLHCVDLILDDERSTTRLYFPRHGGAGGARR